MQAVIPPIQNPITSTITLVQHRVPGGFTVGAIGSSVAVTVAQEAIATTTSYQAGDPVVLSEVDSRGASSKLAWGVVLTATGNTVNVQITARNAAAIASPVFGTTAEITGSTRLAPPTWATKAFISFVVTPALEAIANTSSDLYQVVAENLRVGVSPLAYGGRDIDLRERFGTSFRDTGSIEIEGSDAVANFRLMSAMPYGNPPWAQVTAVFSEGF